MPVSFSPVLGKPLSYPQTWVVGSQGKNTLTSSGKSLQGWLRGSQEGQL